METLTEFKPVDSANYEFENRQNTNSNWTFSAYQYSIVMNKIRDFSIYESSYSITALIQTLTEKFKTVVFGKDVLEWKDRPIIDYFWRVPTDTIPTPETKMIILQ